MYCHQYPRGEEGGKRGEEGGRGKRRGEEERRGEEGRGGGKRGEEGRERRGGRGEEGQEGRGRKLKNNYNTRRVGERNINYSSTCTQTCKNRKKFPNYLCACTSFLLVSKNTHYTTLHSINAMRLDAIYPSLHTHTHMARQGQTKISLHQQI